MCPLSLLEQFHFWDFSSLSYFFFQALAVFILYVRCTRINPADPGVTSKVDDGVENGPDLQDVGMYSKLANNAICDG